MNDTKIDKVKIIIDIVKKLLERDIEIGVKDDLRMFGLDSLMAIKLVVALEEEFGIEIEDDELKFENFDTIEKLNNIVLRKTNADKNIKEKKLYNKVAVITGANKGVGYGIAKELYKDGYKIIAINRTLCAEPWCDEYKCDLSDAEALKNTVDKIASTYKRIDLLVNNAGVRNFFKISGISSEQWEETICTNLTAPLFIIQRLVKQLSRAKGLIIFVGSNIAEFPTEASVAYSCTKSAFRTMSEVAIQDLRYEDIRTCYISLGATEIDTKNYDNTWKILPKDVGEMIVGLTKLSKRVIPSYVTLRPAKPRRSQIVGLEKLQYI